MPELKQGILCPQCDRQMETKPLSRKGNKPPGVFGQCWQKDHRAQTLIFMRNGEAGMEDELEAMRRDVAALKRR